MQATKPAATDSRTVAGFHAGQTVHVHASGELDHDFTGIVTRTDPDNYLVFAEDSETGEVWGMPEFFVTAA